MSEPAPGATDPTTAHALGRCPYTLTDRQREVLVIVTQVHAVTHEACSASLVGRMLHIRREAIRKHFEALRRKGFLIDSKDQARPRRPFLVPRSG